MKYLALLSGDYPELGYIELSSLLSNYCTKYSIEIYSNKIIRFQVEGECRNCDKLVFVKELAEELVFLKKANKPYNVWQNLSEAISIILENPSLNDLLRNNRISIKALKLLPLRGYPSSPSIEKYVGSKLMEKLNLSIDLRNPDKIVKVYLGKNFIAIGILKKILKKSRIKSKVALPYKHPAALTPEVMQLMRNISQAPSKVIADPFCGSATLLSNVKSRGYSLCLDVDRKMLKKALINLKVAQQHTYIDVIVADATLPPLREASINLIATDPPYGRISPTRGASIKDLYNQFILSHFKVLKEGGKISFFSPKKVKWTKPFNAEILHQCEMYVHGDLIRILTVMVNNRWWKYTF